MNIQIRVLFSLLLVLFLYANPVLAGWVVTYAEAESSAQSKEYYQDGKANLGAMVFTGKHFLVVNPESKAYWKGTPQQYCESMGAQFKNMEEQMASLPAQYRPVPISQKKVTRKKIGTKSIAGFSATGYEFYFDGSQKGQVWVSSDSGLSEIIGFERSMSKDMRCFAQMDSASLQGAAIYKQTAENAFPLKESYREVLSVEREDVPASYFQSPDGYTSFDDYQKFMDHISNQSRASSPPPTIPSFDLQSMSRDGSQINSSERKAAREERRNRSGNNSREMPEDVKN